MGLVSGFGRGVQFVCRWEVEVVLVVCRSPVVYANVVAQNPVGLVCRLWDVLFSEYGGSGVGAGCTRDVMVRWKGLEACWPSDLARSRVVGTDSVRDDWLVGRRSG